MAGTLVGKRDAERLVREHGAVSAPVAEAMADGEYKRDSRYIEDRITADGRDGWPVEPGRYRLIAARACFEGPERPVHVRAAAHDGKELVTAMLKRALDSERIGDIRMLCEVDKHLPGYESGKKVSIEVLGPVIEPDQNGRRETVAKISAAVYEAVSGKAASK